MFDDFWEKVSGRLPGLFKSKATEKESSGVRFSVIGHDAYNLKKALKIINSDEKEPLSPKELMSEALKLLEHYAKLKKTGGEYFKIFQVNKKFPIMDFPIDRKTEITLKVRADEDSLKRVETIREILGLKTSADVLIAAINFYVEAVLLDHYGWKILFRSSDGPSGGEPVFDDTVEELSRYRNMSHLAANAA